MNSLVDSHWQRFAGYLSDGGPVMVPLLAVSVILWKEMYRPWNVTFSMAT